MHEQAGRLALTACSGAPREFHALGKRAVVGTFEGGMLSSDGGGRLLAAVERRNRIIERLAEQCVAHRAPEAIAPSVRALGSPRVLGLALGDEARNDPDRLRRDPLLAVGVGKGDPRGQNRRLPHERGKPLASASTLNRLELDAPDDPLPGHQAGRFFPGYEGHCGYLPRYLFRGAHGLGCRPGG